MNAGQRARLSDCGYVTHRTQHQDRCEKCLYVLGAHKQHGRHCNRHNAPVKTHGWCRGFATAAESRTEVA